MTKVGRYLVHAWTRNANQLSNDANNQSGKLQKGKWRVVKITATVVANVLSLPQELVGTAGGALFGLIGGAVGVVKAVFYDEGCKKAFCTMGAKGATAGAIGGTMIGSAIFLPLALTSYGLSWLTAQKGEISRSNMLISAALRTLNRQDPQPPQHVPVEPPQEGQPQQNAQAQIPEEPQNVEIRQEPQPQQKAPVEPPQAEQPQPPLDALGPNFSKLDTTVAVQGPYTHLEDLYSSEAHGDDRIALANENPVIKGTFWYGSIKERIEGSYLAIRVVLVPKPGWTEDYNKFFIRKDLITLISHGPDDYRQLLRRKGNGWHISSSIFPPNQIPLHGVELEDPEALPRTYVRDPVRDFDRLQKLLNGEEILDDIRYTWQLWAPSPPVKSARNA